MIKLKFFLTGCLYAAFLGILSFWNWDMAFRIGAWTVGPVIALSMILSGTLQSAHRSRRNFDTEPEEDRNIRWLWSVRLLLFALPTLILGAGIYFL